MKWKREVWMGKGREGRGIGKVRSKEYYRELHSTGIQLFVKSASQIEPEPSVVCFDDRQTLCLLYHHQYYGNPAPISPTTTATISTSNTTSHHHQYLLHLYCVVLCCVDRQALFYYQYLLYYNTITTNIPPYQWKRKSD